MKVLYDHQMFSLQHYGGITKYFCEIMKNLPGDIEKDIALIYSANAHLHESKKAIRKKYFEFPKWNFPKKNYFSNKLILYNQQYSWKKIKGNNFDLLHPTFYDPYFLEGLKKPFILTVHDLIEFKFETSYGAQNPIHSNMEKLVKRADRLIAISENTKKDIIDIFRINENKIDVIYHGYNLPDLNKMADKNEKYFLFVGARGGYKNFNFFLKAISSLLKKEKDLKLICVGKDFNKEEVDNISSFGISKQVEAMHVSELKLNQLYAGAVAFIFPSLYEGFGMPILEAFANNCPVCLSDTSSFPEVADKAGAYFDPRNEESILDAVEKMLYDTEYRENAIRKGTERMKYFSWIKAGTETAAAYRKTIQ